MPQHVIVKDYSPGYPMRFEAEKNLLAPIFGNNLVSIYHIGSTAVVGLKSKPIIDIMVSVHYLSEVDANKADFEAIGYEYLGEFGIAGRRYMRKGGDERTRQIHIFQEGDEYNLSRHLAVRDYLRAHPEEAASYGKLKEGLAERFPFDIEGYCLGKEGFVKKLEEKALKEWAKRGKGL